MGCLPGRSRSRSSTEGPPEICSHENHSQIGKSVLTLVMRKPIARMDFLSVTEVNDKAKIQIKFSPIKYLLAPVPHHFASTLALSQPSLVNGIVHQPCTQCCRVTTEI